MRRGLAPTRERAQSAITAGRVLVGGARADKPARLVGPGEPVRLLGPGPRFVGRGGEKLDAALGQFGVSVEGRHAVDVGSSTGGFTDCLLQRGAASVVAVDVGRGQLDPRLRADPRVTVRERTNVRDLQLAEPADVVVADVSFVSLRSLAAHLLALAGDRPEADLVVLIKPQFEAGRVAVSRGRGVIHDPETWQATIEGVKATFEARGAAMMGLMVSPLVGAEGNVEFLAHLKPRTESGPPLDVAGVVAGAADRR